MNSYGYLNKDIEIFISNSVVSHKIKWPYCRVGGKKKNKKKQPQQLMLILPTGDKCSAFLQVPVLLEKPDVHRKTGVGCGGALEL